MDSKRGGKACFERGYDLKEGVIREVPGARRRG